MAVRTPHLAVPLRLVPTGEPRPNILGAVDWSGALSNYRVAPGATVTEDETVFHDAAPGIKVVTPGTLSLEGADSGGGGLAVEAGVTYRVLAWVKGNAGGELLNLFVGDGVVGNSVKGFTATTSWQRVELEYTPTKSGTTGVAVVTQGKRAVTYWFDDVEVLGPVPLGVAEVEQDSPEEVAQCVEAVLRTPVGSWIDEPEFGILDQTFEQLGPELSAGSYLAAVEEWEPRAQLIGEAEMTELGRVAVLLREGST